MSYYLCCAVDFDSVALEAVLVCNVTLVNHCRQSHIIGGFKVQHDSCINWF